MCVPSVPSVVCAVLLKDLELLCVCLGDHIIVLDNTFPRYITFIDLHTFNLAHLDETTLVMARDDRNVFLSLACKYVLITLVSLLIRRLLCSFVLCWTLA